MARPETIKPASAAVEQPPQPQLWSQWTPVVAGRFAYGKAGSTLAGRAYAAYETRDGASLVPDTFVALGAEVGGISRSFRSADAFVANGVARGVVFVPNGGWGLEVTSGVATGPGAMRAIGSVGAFWSFYVLELGYAYAFPIGNNRPEWLASHEFTLGVSIPLNVDWRASSNTRRRR